MEQPTLLTCRVCGEEFATTEQLEFHRHEKHADIGAARDARQIQFEAPPQYDESREVF
jgi:hypothetical protein